MNNGNINYIILNCGHILVFFYARGVCFSPRFDESFISGLMAKDVDGTSLLDCFCSY